MLMLSSFWMNDYFWRIFIVPRYHPKLVDRTRRLRVATTDPVTRCIFLSEDLKGPFLVRVLIHELGHCTMFSYGLLKEIHRMVIPEYWIEAEEWICNFLADYGTIAFHIAYRSLGEEAWAFVPYAMENLFYRK